MTVYYDTQPDYVVAVCDECDEDSGTCVDEIVAEQWWLEHAAQHDPATVNRMLRERDDILDMLQTVVPPGVYAVPNGKLADGLIARARRLNETVARSLTYNLHCL